MSKEYLDNVIKLEEFARAKARELATDIINKGIELKVTTLEISNLMISLNSAGISTTLAALVHEVPQDSRDDLVLDTVNSIRTDMLKTTLASLKWADENPHLFADASAGV